MGSDVLAASRFEDFLLTVCDAQVAAGQNFANVASTEPAVFGHDFCGQIGASVVAHHDVGAFSEDFTVAVQLELYALNGSSNGTQFMALARGQIDRKYRRRLRQAIAFLDVDARTGKNARQTGV